MRTPTIIDDRPAAERRVTPAAPTAPPPRGSVWRASARYYVCLGFLVVAAASMQLIAGSLGQYFRKEAVPLKRPLAAADKSQLAPEYALYPEPPEPINYEVLGTLGTEEYLNWRVVDVARERSDRVALAHMFVTYYTGKPDMVPHTPEECHLAGGAVEAGRKDIKLGVSGVGAANDQIPVRIVSFEPKRSLRDLAPASARDRKHVLYFFHCNGRYVTTRDDVRVAQANLFERYAYYAKVEINFTDYERGLPAGLEESEAAAQRLLGKLMPILLKDHLPDWAGLHGRAAAPGDESEGS